MPLLFKFERKENIYVNSLNTSLKNYTYFIKTNFILYGITAIKKKSKIGYFLSTICDPKYVTKNVRKENKSYFDVDIEFSENSSDKAVFYTDKGHSFDALLLYGHEFTLTVWEVLVMSFVDLFAQVIVIQS